jgi:hypothetical protein
MKIQETIFDENAIKHFYKDVLHQLLPKARHQSIGFFGPAEATRAGDVRIDLADSNEINLDSPYFYTKPYTFIHYTSVQSLMHILRSKKLRLYNLEGMDDKQEFVVPLKYLSKNLSAYQIGEIKKRIFCLSLCETSLEDKMQSLSAWREYGDKGNGVGIVLSFEEKYSKQWVYFMLSKIHYANTAHRKFQAIDKMYNEFKVKHNLTVNSFDNILYKYFAFHKHNMYKVEKEVRLIYCQGLSHYDEPSAHVDINRKNEKTSFIELELEWDWDEKTREFIIKKGITPHMVRPVISIDKIIFGYHIANNAKYEIAEVIHELTKDFKKKPEIVDSKLKEQF